MASAATMGKIITAAGLNSDGTHKANATNYGGSTLGEEIKNIDAATKAVSDLVGTTSVESQITSATSVLLGKSTDAATFNTIYGAKRYAHEAADAAKTNANTYTDTEIQKLNVTDTAVANQYVSSVSETDGKIAVSRVALPVTGVKSDDKVLQLTNGEVSSTITMSYVKNDKKIYLYGIDSTTPISEIDVTDFVADSFLDDVELDSSDNLQFTWKMADGSTKTDTVNIAKYIDTYTAGNGLSLSGKEFSVDTTKIATKTSVDNLNTTVSENHAELVSLAGATVNTKAIGTVDADGKVSGNAITLAGSDIAITGYTKGTATDLTTTDTINTALGKLEARVDAAAAGGVLTLNSHSGDVQILTGTKEGTIVVGGGAGVAPSVVEVAGLKSAAYTESSAYATADQGAKADTAIQEITSNNTSAISITSSDTSRTINVQVTRLTEIMSGQFTQKNGVGTPLITSDVVYDFVNSRISDALSWAEFE